MHPGTGGALQLKLLVYCRVAGTPHCELVFSIDGNRQTLSGILA
jgi:hypothetical protein